jgi:glycosyltransferase involved in cell wall biosynthesis
MNHMPLRILHLTTSFPQNPRDSSGIFVWRLAQALENDGIFCQILTPSSIRSSSWPETSIVRRFKYAPRSWQQLANQPGGIPLSLNQHPLLYALVPNLLIFMALHLLLEAGSCDLIHAHWSVCGAVAVFMKPIHRKPIVTTLRGTDVNWAKIRRPYAWLHKKSITGSNFTVGVSDKIAMQMKKEYPRFSNRIAFIPNGVDDSFYKIAFSSRPSPPPVKFLFAGSLIPIKGVDILIKALGTMDSTCRWQLTIAGDGPERGRLINLAEKFSLLDRIAFLGVVPPNKMPSLMADHHILLHMSYSEGRSNVVLEAMASGLAVVGSDIPGIRELVQDGRTGWIVPPGKLDILVEILKTLIYGKNNYITAGRTGREWMIDQRLTWKETARQYRALYGKLSWNKNTNRRR